MLRKLSFITLNVRGINSSRKRRAIFRQLHNKNASIIFLQETYSSNDQERLWSNEWGSKIHFCHGSKHSKGTAILFNPKLQITIEHQIQSEDGRILILQITVDDLRFVCANIYTPNDPSAQVKFFKQLKNLLQQFSGESIVVGGDFNCPFSKDDKEGGRDFSSKKNVVAEIESLMFSSDLEDVWRKLHPNEKQFTWRTPDQKIKCRLDYWLVSKQLLRQSPVHKCEINHAPHCDHSLVIMEIKTNVQHPRGPGFWKFNCSLLEDSDYTENMATKIPQFIENYKHLDDKGLLWEMVKMEIRSFTIIYAKAKTKKRKDYEKILTQEAERLQKLVDDQPTPEYINDYTGIKNKLEKISFDRARGACVRSKARWYEFGERSSKYFLNLEKRNYENKCINCLTKDDNSIITDPKEILEEQRTFYHNLYSSLNPQVNDPRFNLFFANDMINTLDDEQKDSCEGLLTESECRNALKGFQKNKSPGTDGLTTEFYCFFWDQLRNTMIDSFNYGFLKGELSISQRQGIIRLIPKKNKNLSFIKNWRPISLLNVDYKIATKALALRLKKVLPSIINNAQTGYIEGRFIGENIRLISDVIDFTAEQNLEGIALFIDFEKAFDSLEWEFLLKALDTFQFGLDFKNWVKILYTNISSCTINNGYASNWFELTRGVRQGCPLSGLLFVLAVELLSNSIRARNDIKGIQVGNREIKLSQYADDTTSFCKDESSLGRLLELLDIYSDCSGLKLNRSKSEAMWLGKHANRTDTPFEINWPQRPICALGISFSYNHKLCETENFTSKITKLQKLFNVWSQRDLSLYGKITITKTLGLSKLIFSSACIHTPAQVIDIVNNMLAKFIWNGKKPKIKRDTLIGPKDRGGLDLPEYNTVSKSLQCAWVKRMKEGAEKQWMTIPSFYLENIGGLFIFECNYDLKLLKFNSMPVFYIDVLKAWAEVQESWVEDHEQNNPSDIILWNNKNITIAGKSIYWKDWHAVGIERIRDLLDENNKFLEFEIFCRKTGLKPPFTKFYGLISAIPGKWKHALGSGAKSGDQTEKARILCSKDYTCRNMRKMLIQKKFHEPLASSRLCRLGVDPSKLKAIYTLPFNITRETKLSIFQYKIIHNILPYGNRLYMMKIVNSPLCKHCNLIETLSHMLVDCKIIKDFWITVISWWNHQSGDCHVADELSILYGYKPEDKSTRIFNYYILLGKRHIFLQRFELKTPNLVQFFDFVKNKIIVQRSIFHSKGQMNQFYTIWKPLLCLL